ncbi:MAG: MBL fold metallo-hydrolase [bacterium]
MHQLTESVFYQNGYPTSGCAVTPEGVLAVDGPCFPSSALEWRDFIADKGPLRYLVNSEHHFDHIVANRFLGGAVVASEYTNAHFLDSAGSSEGAADLVRRLSPGDASLVEGYTLRPPETVYRGRLTLRLGGQTFRLIHSPGHTRGQTIVHAVEARVAFTGDNLTPGMHPFFHSSSLWEWFESLALLESLDVDWFVPGHGDPCGKEEIPLARARLQERIEEVRRLKAQGRSREEVQEEARYIDRPGLDWPREVGPRAYDLEKAGLGAIFDQLEDHPAG